MRVLLVSPYRLLLKALKQGLEEEGFTVDVASNDWEATSSVANGSYAAIILDLMNPHAANLYRLVALRQAGLKTHILMLAAPGFMDGKILGPTSGFDDWLPAPFPLEVLLERLRAVPH